MLGALVILPGWSKGVEMRDNWQHEMGDGSRTLVLLLLRHKLVTNFGGEMKVLLLSAKTGIDKHTGRSTLAETPCPQETVTI